MVRAMTDPQQTPHPADPAASTAHVPEPIPRGTTPTWEIEMLLSGAVVFALLQLPEALDHSFDGLMTRLGSGWGAVAFLVYCYAKGIVYSLIATFVLHLSARAYWIALVGINSVYPGGPKWAQARMGPIAREESARCMPPFEKLIAEADDRCSLIFASGILLVLLAMYSLMLTAIVGTISFALVRLVAPNEERSWVYFAVGAVLMVPMLFVSLLDRYGRKRVTSPLLERYVRTMQRVMLRMPIMRFANPLMLVIMSNRPKQRTVVLMTLALIAVLYFVVGEALVRRETLRIDSYRFLPDQPTEYAIDAEHYESRRRSGAASILPYIQSEVVTDPYLRLFVPYNGTRHEPALEAACPGLQPFSKRFIRRTRSTELHEPRARDVLACFEKILEVQLDGAPLDALEFNFASDPSGQRGLLAMIPVADLAPGRHVVSLRRPPRPDEQLENPAQESQPQSGDQATAAETADAGGDEERPLLRYEIAFWR